MSLVHVKSASAIAVPEAVAVIGEPEGSLSWKVVVVALAVLEKAPALVKIGRASCRERVYEASAAIFQLKKMMRPSEGELKVTPHKSEKLVSEITIFCAASMPVLPT